MSTPFTIWKFPFPIEDEFSIEMPEVARLLHVDCQGGTPCLWAMVDPSSQRRKIHFALRGTGHPCDGLASEVHVGSFLMHGEALVFHLFRRRQEPTP